MANMALTGILEKMTSKDKDDRSMATSDLLNELSKEGFIADSDLEIKLANTILQQLDDSAGDVSGLAVKCLAPLVKKVNESRVLEMTNKLCDKLLNVKEQHRDVASIALKTIVSEVSSSSAAQVVLDSLTPQLIKGITGSGSTTEIKSECLDIMCDVLHRYGNLMTAFHEELLGALLSQLNFSQATIRKEAVSCIASLASSLSDDLLTKATVEVVELLKCKGLKPEMTRTNIQMIGALSRAVRYRFGPYLGDTVPLLINYCKSASENDEELRECSLQALESFLLRCPRDIAPYCDEILHLTLEFLSYDPNFTDTMEEDTDGENPEEDEDDETANEYTDDEDASWKVRRAAAKCLAGLIVSRPEMVSNLYEEACPKLIDRFKEREENVKMDVFNTFIELLKQTGNVTSGQMDTDEMSPRWLLKQEVPKIVKSINRQLRKKSVKTKVGAFSVLRELVIVLPDCLADQIGSLIPGIEKALLDNSSTSNLKIEALVFTKLVLASHSPSVFHPHIKAISGPVLSAVGERYYKVTAEALRVCGELVRVLRPSIEASGFDFKPYVHSIYNAIMTCLTNQDQEVKECAISCMRLVISTFGDNLTTVLPASLRVLVDCMGNEITGLTAVKGKGLSVKDGGDNGDYIRCGDIWYKIVKDLGKGAYGSVYHVVDNFGHNWAIKSIELTRNQQLKQGPCREITFLRDLEHPNIVRFKDAFVDNGRIHLVMEVADFDLRKMIETCALDLVAIKQFLRQIISAVAYCHRSNIIHRDLKPANILVGSKFGEDKRSVKVADFGLARIWDSYNSKLSPLACTFAYGAPELLLGSTQYTPAVDMWSIGCIMGEMAQCSPVFKSGGGLVDMQLNMFRLMGTPNEDTWPGCSSLPRFKEFPKYDAQPLSLQFAKLGKSGVDLLGRLLTMDPARRISAEEALEHDFFRDS